MGLSIGTQPVNIAAAQMAQIASQYTLMNMSNRWQWWNAGVDGAWSEFLVGSGTTTFQQNGYRAAQTGTTIGSRAQLTLDPTPSGAVASGIPVLQFEWLRDIDLAMVLSWQHATAVNNALMYQFANSNLDPSTGLDGEGIAITKLGNENTWTTWTHDGVAAEQKTTGAISFQGAGQQPITWYTKKRAASVEFYFNGVLETTHTVRIPNTSDSIVTGIAAENHLHASDLRAFILAFGWNQPWTGDFD